MTQNMDCEQARISLGVYVLGAIDPAERAMVDAHLATCQTCRDELEGLAGLPALLAMVNTEEALQLGEDEPLPALLAVAVADPPPPPLPEPPPPSEPAGIVLDLDAARRRRAWRNGLVAAAAAAVIAVGSFAGAHYLVGGSATTPSATGDYSNFGPGGPWETVQLTSKAGQHAWVKYRSVGWGVQIDTRVVGIPMGTTCDLYVITKSGQRLQAASWMTDDKEGSIWYSGSTAVSDQDIAQFQVTTSGTTPPITSPTESS
jgi:Putative zinc-finger